jgi:hypothetical protein
VQYNSLELEYAANIKYNNNFHLCILLYKCEIQNSMLTFFFHFVALNSKSEVRSTHLRLGTHNLQSKQTQNNCATMKLVTILVFPFFSFTFVCISVLFEQRSEQTMSHIDFQGNHNDA